MIKISPAQGEGREGEERVERGNLGLVRRVEGGLRRRGVEKKWDLMNRWRQQVRLRK